ncbi:MAG: GNAT family N-acetyltransferase [Alphaproteobacteria bacterium]
MIELSDLLPWWPASNPVVEEADSADAESFAGLHAACFSQGWGPDEFASMLSDRAIVAHRIRRRVEGEIIGFVVSRKAADEAEILSVAIAPRLRGRGLARRLLVDHMALLVKLRVRQLFLEVEEGNQAAITLYKRLGFGEIGRRKGYYAGVDAITMRNSLPEI